MHSVAIGPTSWWLSSALALKILCSSKLFWAEIEWHYVALSAELSFAGSTPLLAILQRGLVELPSSPAAQLCSKHGFSNRRNDLLQHQKVRKQQTSENWIAHIAPWEIVLYSHCTSSDRSVRVWVPNLEPLHCHCRHAEELVHVYAIATCPLIRRGQQPAPSWHISGWRGFALTSIHIHVLNLPWSIWIITILHVVLPRKSKGRSSFVNWVNEQEASLQPRVAIALLITRLKRTQLDLPPHDSVESFGVESL